MMNIKMLAAYLQCRGVKKLAKKQEIRVKLTGDTIDGKHGQIVSVSPGRMRNLLFKRRLAEYVLRDGSSTPSLKGQKVLPSEASIIQPTVDAVPTPVELSFKDMENSTPIPTRLEFRRKAIISSEGSVFGSVGVEDIKNALREQLPDRESFVQRCIVEFDGADRIKHTGQHRAKISLGKESIALDILVIPEQSDNAA